MNDLDNRQRGQYSEFYNQGVFAGTESGIAKSAEWNAIWSNPSLSLSDKINKLYDAGLDVMGIMAAATMGGLGNRETGAIYKTNKEARIAAGELGFVKINDTIHGGQPIYRKGNLYITRDLDGHNGGAWKMAGSVKDLGSKSSRMGTYDVNLNRIGD